MQKEKCKNPREFFMTLYDATLGENDGIPPSKGVQGDIQTV